MNPFLRYLADKNSAHRHTPMITRPYGLRRAGKKGVTYLKCDTADCKGTAKIDQGLLHMMNDHDNQKTMETEIAELSALERMRKRAAGDDSTSLGNIYLEETRQSTELSSIG